MSALLAEVAHLARVRHRLGIHVPGARFLDRQAVSRPPALARPGSVTVKSQSSIVGTAARIPAWLAG